MMRCLRNLMLAVSLVVVVLGAGSIAQAQQPGEGVTIRAGKASWTSAEPISAITQLLLEELGYTIEGPTMFASNPIAFLAVAQGDIDYFLDGWFPLHQSQLPFGFDIFGSVVGMICEGCAIEGYLVDIPSIEKYGIETLEDFKRPEVKAAFDANGDGKADLFGCPPGWGCYEVIEHHLAAYGLHDHINHVKTDYTVGFADVRARIQNGEPVLFYTWAPNDTILVTVPGKDVKWIGVPYIDLAPAHEGFPEELLIAENLEGAVKDPLPLGFIPNNIQFVANNDFLDNHPAAAALLENIRLPLEWISEATLRISSGEDSDEEILAIAEAWIEENRDLVDGWLQAAREAAK